MKDKFMPDCRIECLCAENEEIWTLSISVEEAARATIFFAAFYLGKIESVKLIDYREKCVACIERNADGEKREGEFVLSLNGKQLSVTRVWLETVVSMFTDVALYGWIDTAHIDQDFEYKQSTITVCVKIEKPT